VKNCRFGERLASLHTYGRKIARKELENGIIPGPSCVSW